MNLGCAPTQILIDGNQTLHSVRPTFMSMFFRTMAIIALALLAAACGDRTTVEAFGAASNEPESQIPGGSSESCNRVGDLRVGLPLFDYDRAEELPELVAAVDVVLQGTLDSAAWAPIEGADPGEGTILLTIDESSPLTPMSPEVPRSVQLEVAAIGSNGDPHPLVDPVAFSTQTQFVAFAYVVADTPDVLQLHPQGLYLRCEAEDPTADSEIETILEPLPSDASSLTFYELVDTISAVAPSKPPRPVGDVVAIKHRVLADGLDTGQSWSAAVITNADILAEVAPALDATIDFETEVVFALNPAESGSCPFGPMAGLEFETLNRVLYPVIPLADDFTSCTSDANPHLILVAVMKADLPEAPFEVWVNEHEPPSGVVDGVATYSSDS